MIMEKEMYELTGSEIIEFIEEKKGIIRLRDVSGNIPRKAIIQASKHPLTKEWLGIPQPHEHKKLEEESTFFLKPDSEVEVKNNTEFDLSTEIGWHYWNMVKYNSIIAFSLKEAQVPGKIFYVDLPEMENRRMISEEKIIVKAKMLIFNDTEEQLLLRATVLGLAMEGDKAVNVEPLMIKLANKDPKKIIDLYSRNVISLQLLLMTAVKKGVVTHNSSTGIYQYGAITLGVSEEAVLASLGDPELKEILDRLKKDVDAVSNKKLFTKETLNKNISQNTSEYPEDIVELREYAIKLGVDPELVKSKAGRTKSDIIDEIEKFKTK